MFIIYKPLNPKPVFNEQGNRCTNDIFLSTPDVCGDKIDYISVGFAVKLGEVLSFEF
jgi:hypothetical protein